MINKFLLAAITASFGLFSLSANAITITEGPFDGTDVGSLDTFEASTDALSNSRTTTEETWVQGIVGDTTLTYSGKVETVAIYSTDAANTYAFSLDPQPYPAYFLVKNSQTWALFENNVDFGWGVFDPTGVMTQFNVNDGTTTISHFTGFGTAGNGGTNGGNGGSVPDGGTTLILLSLALLGFGFFQRRLSSQVI